MSEASGRSDLLSSCEDILVHHLAFGDQLKDDMKDFKQDFMIGRMTYTIQLAIRAAGKQSLSDITPDKLQQAMFEEGIYGQLLNEAQQVYQQGQQLVDNLEPRATQLRLMFQVRLDEITDLRNTYNLSEFWRIIATGSSRT